MFRYPGGKRKLLPEITNLIQKLSPGLDWEYREPFFGGGSVGCSFGVQCLTERIWLNDKDVGICCVWTSVIRYPNAFVQKIKNYNPSVEDYYRFKTILSSITMMPEQEEEVLTVALQKLVLHQISYSGLGTMSGGPLGGRDQTSRYPIDCRWNPEALAAQVWTHHKNFSQLVIREDRCTNYDYSALLSEKGDCTLYLDPPYYHKGGQLYQHGEIDHALLASLLRECRSPWLLSYDDCPEIRELYSWASIMTVDVSYSIVSAKTKTELLIVRTI